MEGAIDQKPHAVCIPFPAQGHINPMLQLAKLFHFRGFHITFVNTTYTHGRLLKSQGPAALNGLKDFRFKAIPDGLPPEYADGNQDTTSLLMQSIPETCLAPFKNLLDELKKDSHVSAKEVPPMTCIISDILMSFSLDAAEEYGIPVYMFSPTGAFSVAGCGSLQSLINKDIIPLKDESQFTNGYLETVVNHIPGMEGIRLKYLPSQLRTMCSDDFMLNFIIRVAKRARRAVAIIINTFDAFEHDVLHGLSTKGLNILPFGPLSLAMNKIPENSPLNSIDSNLWTVEPECISWLNQRNPKSVIYVNYGSIIVITPQQLVEFAWGLANSQCSFLWIIRDDLVIGDKAILPPEFVEETKERGLLTGWCPQQQVLTHPSIGGFLTHCGWNSTLESIVGGVPTICWPYFADQPTNCWLACTKWGIGVELDTDVRRDQVAKKVREVLESDKGEEMRMKAENLKGLAEKAVGSNGSSSLNFEKLVQELSCKRAPRACSLKAALQAQK